MQHAHGKHKSLFFPPPFSRAGAGSEGLPRLPGGCSGDGDGDVLGPAESLPRGEGQGPFVTKVWPLAAGCTNCHYFWSVFMRPFQPRN